VYAGTRQPVAHVDGRVTPLILDVTNVAQIERAVERVGPTDTEMTRDLAIPKASPESVARAIFDGVQNGDGDIFPDPMSRAMADSWRTSREPPPDLEAARAVI
jgi:hypothetical protein